VENRLAKILAHAGVASRRACEELIFDGKVKVNGEICLLPQTKVNPKKDRIDVNGKRISNLEKKVCFALNKPKGYLCSSQRPDPSTKLVIDLFAHLPYRLYTVGRLDKASEGLILVTNDGEFAQEVIHPSKRIEKEYLVKVREFIFADHLEKISKGSRIEGAFVKPKKVAKVRKNSVKITVMEGKKHEVRLLCKRAGLHVMELRRIRIGNLRLGNLAKGSYKEISEKEKKALVNPH